jgi:beta-D-xylosidase 4
LTGIYAKAFVQGLQGSNNNDENGRIQVAAACKHFVANSLEDWQGHSRHNFDAHISLQDLHTYYLAPFQACVQANAQGVMCSYNAVNGIPSCTNEWLLKDILRDAYNFTGYLVTDCGALDDVVRGHHYAIDAAQASALAMNATVDVNCGNGEYYPEGLLQAYCDGWVEASTIQASFARLATIQFRLGLFDAKDYHPDDDIGVVGSHDDLALEAALQSIVLLQNRDGLLPLSSNHPRLALIGPHIHAREVLLSNYHGSKCGCGDDSDTYNCIDTPLQALQKKTQHTIRGVQGCHVSGNDLDEIDLATQAAQDADVVILIVGLDQSQESEGRDRNETTLPGLQIELIQSVLQVASTKTILVVISGGAVALGQNILDQTPAILSAPYGGQAASQALAQVLFGDYNPTGKLAATMYPPSFVDDLPLTEMGLQVGVGRTHMYYQGTPEFAFGYGLSYSKWHLEWADHEHKLDLALWDTGPPIKVEVRVANTGPLEGSQTVLFFWRPISHRKAINQKLIGFQGTRRLEVGQEEVLTFQIQPTDFALWSDTRNATVVSSGTYQLEARASDVQVNRTLQIVIDSSADTTLLASTMQ